MRIQEISIDGFGKFHNYHTYLSNGIQVIYGKNEAGKTTLRQFMIAMLFGLEKGRGLAARNDVYSRYIPIHGGKYGGTMVLCHDGETWRIQRDFLAGQQEVRLFREKTMEEIPLYSQTLENVLFQSSKDAFENTVSMTQMDIRTGKEMQQILKNSMANLSRSQDAKLDIGKAVEYLKLKRRQRKKDPIFTKTIQLRQRLLEFSFSSEELEKYQREEERLEKKLSEEKTYSIFQRILLFIKKMFGVDEESMQRREILHQLEIVQLNKKHLLEKRDQQDQLKQQYQQSLKQRKEAEQEIYAMEQAVKAIETAAENIQKTFGEELNEKLSEIFLTMTGGSYQNAVMDASMNFMVKKDFDYIDMKYLSNGTMEQLYFALRLSAAELLYAEDGFPLFLDDVFGNYDEERIQKTLSYLDTKNTRQVFLFTCRQEMLKILEKADIDYHLISL